jgi:hypothetical protein
MKPTMSILALILLSILSSTNAKIRRRLENHEASPVDHEGEEENQEEHLDEESIEEVSPGLVVRPGYAFKELDPENPELNHKEDIEHDEDGISEMQKYFHIFEDYNYENIEKQLLKEKIELRLRSVLKFYEMELKKLQDNPSLNDSNVGPYLTGLFGENFKKIIMDLKEIEISVKAALEKTIDQFFLFKCEDRTFHSSDDFHNCLNFKKDIKRFMMFENFYEIGFYNKIHDLFEVRELYLLTLDV